jgi:2-dehydropantoate 2-reductase
VRYIIIGAGAVGGTIGGRLFEAGHEVVLVARGAHLAALREGGLRLAVPEGEQVLDIPAAGGPDDVELRRDDVLVVATKSQDSVAVLSEWARQPVAGGTVAAETLPVVCAQNGVANERFALRRFRNVYGMCVWLPGTHLAPGVVVAHGAPRSGLLVVGRYPTGTDDTIAEIAAGLAESRFIAPVSIDVMRWKYSKLLANLGNAVEALCGRPGDGPGQEAAAEVGERARAEGRAVLDAAGIGYASPQELHDARGDQVEVRPVGEIARAGGSSWQSLTRGTGSIEADFLNGEIALLGRAHGVPAPVNEALQVLANRAAAQAWQPGAITPAQILDTASEPSGSAGAGTR